MKRDARRHVIGDRARQTLMPMQCSPCSAAAMHQTEPQLGVCYSAIIWEVHGGGVSCLTVYAHGLYKACTDLASCNSYLACALPSAVTAPSHACQGPALSHMVTTKASQVQGMAPSGLQAEEGQEAGALAAAGQSGPVVPRERPHVKFSEHNERRE